MANKALILGINDYKNVSDLRGCINDVHNMKRLLTETYDFDAANIKMIENKDVIRDHIVDGFRWLFDGAKAGDRLVFHFSGHGSYIPSKNDDESIDELVCLWDMDWDSEDSYLIDDDLGDLTKSLPKGAKLTIVLDSCHSGTGTKAISGGPKFIETKTLNSKSRLVLTADTVNTQPVEKQSKAKSRLAKAGASFSPKDENFRPVFARFIYPPMKMRVDDAKAKVRRLGKSVTADQLNHQLLAAARDDQTAADAFIDNDYQGAFTYYLCKSARDSGNAVPSKTIFAQTQTALQSAGYSQVPQMEGLGASDRLFGGEAIVEDTPKPIIEDALPAINSFQNSAVDKPADRYGVLSQLLTVQEKFLELGNKLFESAPATVSPGAPGRQLRALGNEVIVYVHGISRHVQGYSDAWYASLSPFLSAAIPKSEVYWSDIVNPRSLGTKSLPTLSKSAIDLQKAIERELAQRQQQVDDRLPPGTSSQRSLERSSGFSWDDFVRYMTNESTRNEILQRFYYVVRPLLESGKTIHIVSHSWGTVIAYEGLRNMDDRSLSGQVKNLFVVGAALSMGAVQWNLFSRVADGRKPRYVQDIINLDAGGDIVGGSLQGTFTITTESLNLKPTNCSTIQFTNTAWSVSCAHSSYFDKQNIAVNRDIFARWING